MSLQCDFCGKEEDFLYPSPNDDRSEDKLCEECFDPIAEKLTEGENVNNFIKLAHILNHATTQEIELIDLAKHREFMLDLVPNEILTCDKEQRRSHCRNAINSVLSKLLELKA